MANKVKIIVIACVAVVIVCIVLLLMFSGVGIMIGDKLQYDNINKTANTVKVVSNADAQFVITADSFDIAVTDEYTVSNETEQMVYYKNSDGSNTVAFHKEPITVEFDIEEYIEDADSDELKEWFELVDSDIPQSYFEYCCLALTISDDDYSAFNKGQSALCSALVSHKETLYETCKSISVYNGEDFSAIVYSDDDGMQMIEVCRNSNANEIFTFTAQSHETATELLNGLRFK